MPGTRKARKSAKKGPIPGLGKMKTWGLAAVPGRRAPQPGLLSRETAAQPVRKAQVALRASKSSAEKRPARARRASRRGEEVPA
jgi:hypothetical protein